MATIKVLDTDVFIDHFRGMATATAYIQGLLVGQRATTDVTIMELYKGATNREQLATIERFLTRNHVTRLCLAAAISQRAVTLLHTYVLAHGLSIPDALIAALVLEGNHTLVTSNVRHCQFIPGNAWSQLHIGCARSTTIRKDKLCSHHSWRAAFNRASSSS